MKISSIQLDVTQKRNKELQITHALEMLDRCAGSDLIVLPELWNIGFYNFDSYSNESETDDGITMSAISAKARELGSYIYSGTFVEQRDGKLYNSGILFDRNGNKLVKYSKMHLFTYQSREAEILTPGSEIAVADTEFGKIGIATCYDLRFPELFRKMTFDYGVEMFIVAAAWPSPRIDAWNTLNCARAIENISWLVSSNCTGNYAGIQGGGHGKIVDPWGKIIADSGFEETIVQTEIAFGTVKEARQKFPALNDIKLL